MKLAEHMDLFDPHEEIARIEEFLSRKRKIIGFNRGIIGLSGGIDSSLTTVLAKRALTDQHLEIVFLPDATTPEQDVIDVKELAGEFDLTFSEFDIDPLVTAFRRDLGPFSELAAANLKARIRMVVLYAIANQKGGLVLGTGNLSEYLLGYFTKYGDGAADIAPLTHLYKEEVKEIASCLQIPESIISKPPSAGLWDGQTDEEELGGSYEDIDKVLYLKHDCNYPLKRAQSTLNLESDFVKNIYDMVDNSAHKREEPAGLDRKR